MQQKKKICKNCGNEEFIFSRKRCKRCATIEDTKPLNRAPIVQKKYTIPKQTQKNKKYRISQSAIRNEFFENMIEKFNQNPVCSETGLFINNLSRWNICHILPKRTYKSVQCEEDNVILFCVDKHTEFDKYLDTFDFKSLEEKFPKSWLKVCKQVKNLLSLCKENGKLKIQFEEYLINL